jgi:chemotaxis protein methyltransferase CheR
MTAHAAEARVDDYAALCEKVRRLCGADLTQYERGRMESRVRAWVQRRGAASLDVYADLLRRDPDELDAFLDRVRRP